MRYTGTSAPYARVKQCFYENGALTFVDDFPITGESTEVLYPTTNSRYGNVELVPEVLRQLSGRWESGGTSETITIRGDKLLFGYGDCPKETVRIVAVRSRSTGEVELVDHDPGRDMIAHFCPIKVQGDRLVTGYPVCDAPMVPLIFERVKE